MTPTGTKNINNSRRNVNLQHRRKLLKVLFQATAVDFTAQTRAMKKWLLDMFENTGCATDSNAVTTICAIKVANRPCS